MPVGIYLTVPFGEVKRGDYVIFFMPEHIKPQIDGRRWALQYNVPIVKRVMGISNDQFTVTDREITINGQYIGPVFLEDSEGLSMPRLRGTFRIEQGMILPISDYSNRSFDGRYFGTIPVSEIKAKVIPLLTF
jgi:conjugative transfer signal peptidase TraF